MNRVLISGGSRGIGAALVRAFSQNGDAVAFGVADVHTAVGQHDESQATAVFDLDGGGAFGLAFGILKPRSTGYLADIAYPLE